MKEGPAASGGCELSVPPTGRRQREADAVRRGQGRGPPNVPGERHHPAPGFTSQREGGSGMAERDNAVAASGNVAQAQRETVEHDDPV